jgi:acyl-CoA synthetase (AMP-forming)/AMP-acid ligase II
MKRALEYTVKPVFKVLDDTASKYPDRIGFIEPGKREYTYGEIKNLSDLLAARLLREGLGKGDRVLVLLPNSVEFVVSYYGIQKAGGTVVPLNILHTDRELKKYVPIVEPAGVIASSDLYENLESLRRLEGFKYMVQAGSDSFLETLAESSPPEADFPQVNVFEDLAVIPFSSGTTGVPKGVALTHSNLCCNIQQIIDAHELFQEDIFVNHLPFFHIYGMNVLLGSPVFMGARQIILSGLEPEILLDTIESYGATVMFTVPAALNYLVKHSDLSSRNLRSLRFLNIGGGPLTPEIGAAFTSATGVTVNQAYGLTESSPTTHANPLARIKHDSIGLAIADTFSKIVDPLTLQEAEPGERGELWIKGPQIMRGYYRNPEASREALVDGWLRTGDIAWMDGEGYTFIVDRLKELIKYKSYQVPPAELEHLLLEIAEVVDCAVVGRPDEEAGELPVAFVAAGDRSVTEEYIREYVSSRVAPYKKIRQVIFVDAIPRAASGKVLRRSLRDQYFGGPKQAGLS